MNRYEQVMTLLALDIIDQAGGKALLYAIDRDMAAQWEASVIASASKALSTGYTPPIWPAPFIPKPPDTLPCLPPEPPAPVVKKTGFVCTVCRDKNDFAEANQPDGTYQCSHHKRSLW